MNKTEIKNANLQELIETLMWNESVMMARNGQRIKGLITESRNIAKELSDRGLIDFDSFVKNKELE
jgi:hypothetical protein